MINGKMTLLDIVQGILASMDSDEVDSINDTVEAYDIALLCRDVFYDISTDLALEEHDELLPLIALADPTKPTVMTVPENVSKVYWVKYNQAESTDINPTFPLFIQCDFLPFQDFLDRQQGLRSDVSADNGGDVGIQTVSSGTATFDINYRNDKFPQFYTTFENTTIIFDSFKVANESTMQSVNSLAGCRVFPEFSLVDTFVPPLDNNQFSYYRNKCKFRAFAEKKQVENKEAGMEMKRQKQVIIRDRDRVDNRAAIFKVQSRFGRKASWTDKTNFNGD